MQTKTIKIAKQCKIKGGYLILIFLKMYFNSYKS